jgi:peptidoglycan/xylan/chitin deacetylase (PgdA/CDA1 family)
MKASKRAKTLAVTILDLSGIPWLLRPFLGGRGTILSFHRILPANAKTLNPGTAVTTTQLESILRFLRKKKWDIIPLSEIPERLRAHRAGRYFVSITLDDGCSDNLHLAAPLFQKYNAPFCVFVNSGVVDRSVIPWWTLVEPIILGTREIVIEHPSKGQLRFSCDNYDEKCAAMRQLLEIGWRDRPAMREALRNYCSKNGMSVESLIGKVHLSWDELRCIARDPLGSVGSHTVSHDILSELSLEDARYEIQADRERLEAELGRPVEDIAYPLGSPAQCGPREFEIAREAGFLRGVTTHRWNLFSSDSDKLLALPRVTVSMAHSESARFVRVSAYGAWNALVAIMR